MAYKDIEGVAVATRIALQPLVYRGVVDRIAANKNTLTVGHGKLSRTFALAPDCKFIIKDGKEGRREDGQIGHKVSVIYELPEDKPVARRIEQKSSTLVGDLSAIDVPERTVKTKYLLGDKLLSLADDCRILINGKPDAQLSDLKIGQRYAFSFDELDGVRVVNRIASVEGVESAETTQSASR